MLHQGLEGLVASLAVGTFLSTYRSFLFSISSLSLPISTLFLFFFVNFYYSSDSEDSTMREGGLVDSLGQS